MPERRIQHLAPESDERLGRSDGPTLFQAGYRLEANRDSDRTSFERLRQREVGDSGGVTQGFGRDDELRIARRKKPCRDAYSSRQK